jgi:hypothetical protein
MKLTVSQLRIHLGIAVAAMLLCTTTEFAQSASRKSVLAITTISATPSLKQKVEKAAKALSLGQVVESLDSQLLDRFNATRKFELVSRSDLVSVIKEQDFGASGNLDPKTIAQIGKVTGAKHILVTTLDNFQDITRTEELKIQKEVLAAREIRLSLVGKIYDAQTGKLFESANYQTSTNKLVTESSTASVDGNRSDDLLVAIARDMAEKVANRVADVVFPAKVLTKRDKQIMINRGDGTGIAVGQVWSVFAVGETLIDPDTKEALGQEEVLIGKAKVISVQPKTATAQLLEDSGVTVGAVLRLPSPSP